MLRASPCPERIVNTVLTSSRLSLFSSQYLESGFLTNIIVNLLKVSKKIELNRTKEILKCRSNI